MAKIARLQTRDLQAIGYYPAFGHSAAKARTLAPFDRFLKH